MEEFKDRVKEFIELDDSIKQVTEQVNKLKLAKKNLTLDIMNFMKANDLDVCNLTDGKLNFKKSQVKETLGKRNIKEKLTLFFNTEESNDINELSSEEKVDNIMNFIEDNLSLKDKESLTRYKSRR